MFIYLPILLLGSVIKLATTTRVVVMVGVAPAHAAHAMTILIP